MQAIFPNGNDTISLSSSQVHITASELLSETFNAVEINGYSYTHQTLWDVLLYASVHRASVESVCQTLSNTPSSNWIYTMLKDEVFDQYSTDQLEEQLNEALTETFPNRLTDASAKMAIDLVLIPYYGTPTTDGISRSKAKSGTTKFFCYASAYLIKHNKRVTLAITVVTPELTMTDLVQTLVKRVTQLGISIKRLYLDREFQ